MKFFLAILLFSSTLFLWAQKEMPCYVYVNGKLHKTAWLAKDSSFHHQLIGKIRYPYLILDSVRYTQNSVLVYLHSLYEKAKITIKDTSSKVIVNKQCKLVSVSSVFADIIQQYANRGHPFTRIELEEIVTDSTQLSFIYQINLQEKYYYDSLDIIGKPIVSKTFLHAYLGIKPGKVYKQKEIQTINKNIDLLPFYKRTQPALVFFVNNKARPRIELQKSNANQFSGMAAFGTNTENKLIVQGDIQVNLNNLFKHADSWKIQWKKNDAYSQNLFLEGNYPYIFSYPIGLSGFLTMIKQDTSYVTINYKSGIDFFTRAFNGISIFFEKKQTNVLTAQPFLAPISLSMAGISLKQLYVNQLILPSKGYGVNFSIAYGQKKLTSRENLSEQLILSIERENKQITANGELFALLPVAQWLTTNIRLSGAYLYAAHVKNELYRCGGSHSIRGFDEESIFAQSYAIGTIEPRFIVDKNSHLFLFYDKMFYRSLNNIKDEPWSIGLGTELNTSGGVFFISYAMGSQFNQPLQFRTAKLHFGYRNKF